MSISPNQVNRTVLLGSGGDPVSKAIPISNKKKARGEDSKWVSKKASIKSLTLSNWPSYNSTLAPTSTRSSYSIAQDANGMVVISGGNVGDSISLFQATENTWLNTTSVFTLASKTESPLTSTPASVSAASVASGSSLASTASAQPSDSAIATSSKSTTKSDSMKVLGAVLGSVVGLALFLFAILLLLRHRRKRREHAELGHQRRASGLGQDEKDVAQVQRSPNYGSSFLDLDTSSNFQGHKAGKESHSSFSSMAILMGKVGQSAGHKRGGLSRNDGSNASSADSMFNKKYKNAISNPIPQENGSGAMNGGLPGALVKEVSFESDAASRTAQTTPTAPAGQAGPSTRTRASNGGRRGSTRRSSGWNRYWSGGSGAMNILGLGSKRNTYSTSSDRSTNSQYSAEQRMPSQVPRLSALEIPPSSGGNFGLSRVATGSPTVSYNSDFQLTEGISGQISHSRIGSVSSEDSFDARRQTDPFSSGVPESVHEFGAAIPNWETPLAAASSRTGSSAYSSSNYDRTTVGTSFHFGGGTPTPSLPSFPSVPSFPAPPTSRPPVDEGDKTRTTSDMSWLNLGADSSRDPGVPRI